MSIRLKAALVILLIVFSITAANFVSSMFFTRHGLIEAMEKWQTLDCKLADKLVSTQISLLKSNASTVSERLRDARSKEEMVNIMKTQLEEFPDFMAFAVFTHDSKVAGFGDLPDSTDQLGNNPYLQAAFEGKSVISTSRKPLEDDTILVFHVYVPMEENRVLSATISGMFFRDLVSEYQLWETGSIFILDGQGTYLAHHNIDYVFERLNYIERAKTDPTLQSIGEFYEKMISCKEGVGVYSLQGKERVCSYRKVTASAVGWVIGVVAPIHESPQITMQRGLLFSSLLFLVIGTVVAVFLSNAVVLPFAKIEEQNRHLENLNDTVRLQSDRIQGEYERQKRVLDSMPLTLHLWNQNHCIFDCNEEAVNLFHVKTKEECLGPFLDFSPLYQPDGVLSREKAEYCLTRAFDDGKHVFEWMHQWLDGTPIPTEVTLVRIKLGETDVIAAYVRSLQEHKKMMLDIEQRDKLLKAGNNIATILLATTNENRYENSLLSSMEFIGRCLGVDRVQFWKNEMIDGEHCFIQKHQWLSEIGRQKTNVPLGLKHRFRDFPDWESLFSRGECVNGPVSKQPEHAQRLLHAYGIDSIVIIPLLLQECPWGFFVLNDCHQERTFTTEEIDILHSVGLLMINAVQRNEMTLNLRDTAVQLEKALEQAREANQAKSDFLANMSHEMRTPLNAVLGLSVLALEASNLDDESRANIEKIYNAGATLLSTVNDILDISKIEAGKFELIPSEYDVPSLINDTVIQNMVRIGDKPIEFVLDIDGTLPSHIYGDELRVKQILNNLLSNAFKYTMEGTVKLSLYCTREKDSVWLTVQVRDTGLGIRQEDMDHLFDNYTKLDTTTNRHIEGTGLGLPICKQLAEMMDGSIHVESKYGSGSVFTIRLRQKFVTDVTIGTDLAENLKKFKYSDNKRVQNAKLSRLHLPYATVLVVDDIATNLDVAKGLLKPYLMQVHCVTGGQQAIDAIREEKVKYNAVFMDHMMPGMNGIEATRLIRQIETEYAQNVPIIAMTANAIVGSEQMFLNNGFQAFLSKPIDISRLDEIVRHWIRDKEQEKEYEKKQSLANSQEQPKASNEINLSVFGKIVETNIDLEKALRHFGGDWETLADVLHSFAVHIPALLDTIKGVNKNNLTDYTIAVHGIKGASRGIFANMVGDAAETLEEAGKKGNLEKIMDYNPSFIETTQKLVEQIKDLLQSQGRVIVKAIKDKPDVETLAELLTACQNYAMDAVDAAMAKLEDYDYESDGELVAWLRENVDQMNFMQIKEKLTAVCSSAFLTSKG